MAQFKDFSCVVTNGNATVRAIWEVVIGTIASGPFTVGEALTWAATGVGVHVIDQAGRMRLYRTAGEEPEAGDTITGGASGASCPINEVPIINEYGVGVNPPRFADSPSQGAIQAGDGFVVNAALVSAVYGQVGGSLARDSFALVAVWPGDTLVDVPGYVVRDFTANNSYPLVNPGDARAATVIAKALMMIDTVVVAADWKDVVADSVSGWQGNWDEKSGTGDYEVRWRHEFGRVIMAGAAERTPNFTPAVFQRTSYQHVSRNAALAGGGDQSIQWDNRIGYEDDTIVEANIAGGVETPGVWSGGKFRLGVNGLYVLKAHIQYSLAANGGTPPYDAIRYQFRDVTTGTPALITPASTQRVSTIGYYQFGLYDQHNLTAYFEVTGAPTTKPMIDLYLDELVASEFTSLVANNESWMSVQYFNPFSATEANELLFTLPAGDRPRHKVITPVQDGNYQERIEIDTDGTVRYKGYGDGASVDLSHVTFTVV